MANCSFTTSRPRTVLPKHGSWQHPELLQINFKKDDTWLGEEAVADTSQWSHVKRHANGLGAALSFSEEPAMFLPFWIVCNIAFQQKR